LESTSLQLTLDEPGARAWRVQRRGRLMALVVTT